MSFVVDPRIIVTNSLIKGKNKVISDHRMFFTHEVIDEMLTNVEEHFEDGRCYSLFRTFIVEQLSLAIRYFVSYSEHGMAENYGWDIFDIVDINEDDYPFPTCFNEDFMRFIKSEIKFQFSNFCLKEISETRLEDFSLFLRKLTYKLCMHLFNLIKRYIALKIEDIPDEETEEEQDDYNPEDGVDISTLMYAISHFENKKYSFFRTGTSLFDHNNSRFIKTEEFFVITSDANNVINFILTAFVNKVKEIIFFYKESMHIEQKLITLKEIQMAFEIIFPNKRLNYSVTKDNVLSVEDMFGIKDVMFPYQIFIDEFGFSSNAAKCMAYASQYIIEEIISPLIDNPLNEDGKRNLILPEHISLLILSEKVLKNLMTALGLNYKFTDDCMFEYFLNNQIMRSIRPDYFIEDDSEIMYDEEYFDKDVEFKKKIQLEFKPLVSNAKMSETKYSWESVLNCQIRETVDIGFEGEYIYLDSEENDEEKSINQDPKMISEIESPDDSQVQRLNSKLEEKICLAMEEIILNHQSEIEETGGEELKTKLKATLMKKFERITDSVLGEFL